MTFTLLLKIWRRRSSVSAKYDSELLVLFGSLKKLWQRGLGMRPLRILNVAEKNDAAKELSRIMSRGQCLRVSSLRTCVDKTKYHGKGFYDSHV